MMILVLERSTSGQNAIACDAHRSDSSRHGIGRLLSLLSAALWHTSRSPP
jgi:hypothetical protein